MLTVHNHRIRYFYEAIKFGGIRAAADALNVAPSAISRQITLLEQELGTPLMERGIKGVVATEAGETVLAYFRKHSEHQQDLIESLSSLKGLTMGEVIIASGEGYIRLLAEPIAAFSAQYPNIKIKINVRGSNDVMSQVIDNEAHIGVVYNPSNHPKIRAHFEAKHPLCAFLNADHPLAQQAQPIDLLDLAHERLAFADASHGIRQIIKNVETEMGLLLSPTLVCNHLTLLKKYAMEGGVTLLPDFMLHEEDQPYLQAKLLTHPAFNQTKTKIITRLGRQLPPAASIMLKLLVQTMKKI
ncbi:MAG: LysR family transcriptional regulator [Neisseriaceae bacterium]|nr:LysR family transcriptional regulator [Neisseriaceae bacterium]